jgi:hypothetical protein
LQSWWKSWPAGHVISFNLIDQNLALLDQGTGKSYDVTDITKKSAGKIITIYRQSKRKVNTS